jgi:hypothetical protein
VLVLALVYVLVSYEFLPNSLHNILNDLLNYLMNDILNDLLNYILNDIMTSCNHPAGHVSHTKRQLFNGRRLMYHKHKVWSVLKH